MLPYATPEWLEGVRTNYAADPDNQSKIFKGLNIFLTFRVEADAKLGIERDLYFALHWVDGALQPDSTHLSRADAEKKSDFILAAPLPVWKKLIKKEAGFVSTFMTGKVKVDKGSGPRIMALASKSPMVVDAFNKMDTEWPDEMPPQRLKEYAARMDDFRRRSRV